MPPKPPLPIDAALPELLARLREAGACVLQAPTGAGKTSRVPPAILNAGLAAGEVLMLEPRRVAARAAARRMALEDGTPLGGRYGYHVRLDRRAGRDTRCLAVTPGILLRRLQGDPFLESVSAVVFDEFHERGLESDLALGLVRLLRQTVRPDLLCVVMSATLDAAPLSEYLGGAPVVASAGRAYPVALEYRPRRGDVPATEAVVTAVQDKLSDPGSDVLAFLPGVGEIRRAAEALRDCGALVLPLHGEMDPEEQDAALRLHPRRKVVLATNVAEASVTVEGVTVVVDSGLARQMEFEPSTGLDRLRLGPISRASADQRAGRAGRTAPGVCVRLWDEPGHAARPAQTPPELRRVDLSGAALTLLALGESDVARFPWLDAPRPEAVAQALGLLERLGATEGGALTKTGRLMSELPLAPRLARMVLGGARLGAAGRAALAAAILGDRDPFPREPAHAPGPSDVLERVEAVETKRLARYVAEPIRRAADQILAALPDVPPEERAEPDDALLRAVFAGYPDRLCRRRGKGEPTARMSGGRGVRLAPQSAVRDAELFVAVDVDAGDKEAWVRSASAVRRDWLPPERIVTEVVADYDDKTDRLTASRVVRYDDVVLDESPAALPAGAWRALADAAKSRMREALPDAESDAGRWLARARFLAEHFPELALPPVDDAALSTLLPDVARDRRSLAELRSGPWLDHLSGRLTWDQRQAMDREAPDSLRVPSGSDIRLTYEPGRPPVLAARIQELFGLAETPRVAGGRVKVLLHLLAPNYRPQQVTDDLASFWATGYHAVRKDLRGRYPKHSWPDDPTTADAIRGPKKRA